MKKIKVISKLKIRKLSWKVRPVLLAIDDKNLMVFISICSFVGLMGCFI